MANVSVRMRDDLKLKAKKLAKRQGVSLNNFINAVLAACIAQEETLTFFDDRLKDVDLERLRERVLAFMSETQPGEEPSVDELREAMGDRF